jgi:serine/threonine protein kinase
VNTTTDLPYRPQDDDPRLLRAAQDYLGELEAGRRPERAAFLARFPDLARELAPYLDALDMVQSAATAVQRPEGRSAASEALPQEPLGDFHIVREIGRGGMGVVYEAVQLSLGRRVALKVLPFATSLDGKQLQRFKNEAQAAAQLHHSNIVPVYAVGCERGVHYYAMQLIEGHNLADLITQLRRERSASTPPGELGQAAAHGVVTPAAALLSTQRASRSPGFYRTAVRLILQAAGALEHAHEFGVIHRDVKPANLLVDQRGTVWVTDFGLAQFHTSVALTRSGDLLGTLRYMSPEQAAGHNAVPDVRTDVYALGATLYELLTLRPLFEGTEHARLLADVLHNEPAPPRAVDPALPAELETIVLKAVSKSPADRYATARAFADDLQRFLDNRPILARRPTLSQRARKWAQRHPALVGTCAVLLVLVALGSLVGAVLVGEEQAKTQAAYDKVREEQLKTKEAYDKLRAEQHKTQTAYDAERQRADEADGRFRLARKSVDELIELSEQLVDQRGMEGLRKRILESALEYYQVFIAEHSTDPEALADLIITQEHVRKILDDLAALQSTGQFHHLKDPAVQTDLHLKKAQRDEVASLLDRVEEERKALFQAGRDLPSDQKRERWLELARAHDAEIKAVLSPKQLERLRQIALQLQGIGAFRDPAVVAALKLTGAQKDGIRAIEMADRPPPGKGPQGKGPKGGAGPKGPPPGPPDLERVLALLTVEQRQQWTEMAGPPFKGPPRDKK